MPTYYIETYGCWLNKADSALMEEDLRRMGYVKVNDPAQADLILVNTCAVREDSEIRELKAIEKYSRLGKKLIVAGCLTKARPSEIMRLAPDALIVNPSSVENLAELLKGGVNLTERLMVRIPKYYESSHVYVVPIQVGCLGNCSYCVIKYTRGGMGWVKSADLSVVKESIAKAVARGAREIYLTGQEISAYGKDKGYDLVDLLEAVLRDVEGRYLIRLGMLEPLELEGMIHRLIDVIKNDWRIYRFFHIPVQSGSDKVLRLMKRKYTVDLFKREVELIRRSFRNSFIATDIIVGHPGEDDSDFQESVRLIRELGIDKVHVARYSPRPFTEAAYMRQVPDQVKKQRSSMLSKVALEVAYSRNLEYVGGTYEGLISSIGFKGRGLMARLMDYRPVIINEGDLGSFVKIKVTGASSINLIGKIIE
ncbi:tRNA (N(6)-L-threonylcarbamoyladenosine(37)-C(2))-methylthiotransferase [Caldivirga maquilingensis]|uniref:tRNA-t(6)A37 methylthiotransferase n=1 Tax=Caldivirga maquilingensis (strain ATCC 700844 / DSM 13496 / JCM 10307 / IC-167) TaxID=397948 RepID=A8MDH8_CALMQ|nr:tRNA (N(6)-L-threonylcarbamoyladenosine(37)-C(2))-methylthiotransferase [Caldivirga maquilingensis]ABW01834.1 RNA modification enzyme, MiaB family [Caldivirga maquilingensis IC-167]